MRDITESNRMCENRYSVLLFKLLRRRRRSIELCTTGTITESLIIFSACSLCEDPPLDGALTLNLTANNSNSWLAGTSTGGAVFCFLTFGSMVIREKAVTLLI